MRGGRVGHSRRGSGAAMAVALALAALCPAGAAEPLAMVEAEAGADVQVSGATPAALGEWPATFRFFHGGKACTSTLVGERAVLTAAHCVSDGQIGTIRVAGRATTLRCDHHPSYARNRNFDIALCLVDRSIALPNGAPSDTLNADPALPAVNTEVTLLGYGCRSLDGSGPSGALYQGSADLRVARFILVTTVGGAALCFGDSGGAGYFQDGGGRRIFGVNALTVADRVSRLVNVGNPKIRGFIKGWADRRQVGICGVTGGAGRCR